MKRNFLVVVGLLMLLSGCADPVMPLQTTTSVTPSKSGIPNTAISLGNYEFVSVQETGQIFTYNISQGFQAPVGTPYATSCSDPSGMVIAQIAGNNVMAVVCYDTSSILTLTVHADGSLSALGSAKLPSVPYPGVVLDGMNVFVPLFGQSLVSNGGVAKVSLASPATPVVLATTGLASPVLGGFANPGYLAVSGGYIFAVAGSESSPLDTSSTVQVVNEATMTLAGAPLAVAHSPQQIAVQAGVAYVTLYDATELESIDISNPASLRPLQIFPLATANSSCHAIPIVLRGSYAYVGCYAEGAIDRFDITNPAKMQLMQSILGIATPQRLDFAGNYLLVPSSASGGPVYQIYVGAS